MWYGSCDADTFCMETNPTPRVENPTVGWHEAEDGRPWHWDGHCWTRFRAPGEQPHRPEVLAEDQPWHLWHPEVAMPRAAEPPPFLVPQVPQVPVWYQAPTPAQPRGVGGMTYGEHIFWAVLSVLTLGLAAPLWALKAFLGRRRLF